MSYLLNLLYLALLLAAAPWLLWQSLRKGKYRQGFAEKLLGRVPRREGDRPCMWLHAVSVGEVNLLGPLVESRREDDRQMVRAAGGRSKGCNHQVLRGRIPSSSRARLCQRR